MPYPDGGRGMGHIHFTVPWNMTGQPAGPVRAGEVGDGDGPSPGVAARVAVRPQLVEEARRHHAGLLTELAARGGLEVLVDADEPAGEGQPATERFLAALDEQHLERVVPDGQADHVHGDREDRVLAGVDHGTNLLVHLTTSNRRCALQENAHPRFHPAGCGCTPARAD